MMDLATVTLAILAGGRGTRMGQPKALLQMDDQPILKWQLDRLRWPGPTLLVTTPSLPRPPGAERFDQIAVDPEDDLGPVRGILTALQQATTPLVAIIPVDMPKLKSSQLGWMAEQCIGETGGVMCRAGDSKIVQPLPLVIQRSAICWVEVVMNSPRRAVGELAKQPGFITPIAPSDWPVDTWMNLNNPQALQAFIEQQQTSTKHKRD